jgi:hypothetical protein
MKDRKQKDSPVSPPEAAPTPFFVRFLEGQHGSDAEAMAGPSRQTLKYPSDRDEDGTYVAPYGNTADAL